MQNWKKEILSIPNILSLFRLLLIPVYTMVFLRGHYAPAAVILAISTLTDMADGQIARRFNMITNLGKVLDPVADKATQFTLIICLAVRHSVLWYALGVFVLKEGFMLVMGIVNLRRRKMLDGALMAGKICTTVLFVSMIVLVLLPDLNTSAVAAITIVCIAFMILSFADYFRAYLGKERKVQDI